MTAADLPDARAWSARRTAAPWPVPALSDERASFAQSHSIE